MKRVSQEWILTLPSLLWLVVFFAIPTVLVLSVAFRPADLNGGIGTGWTLDSARAVLNPAYLPILWRTFWLSAAATLICLLLSVPVAWHLARARPRWRDLALLLIVLPFLTNFLIRIFAWKSLLHPEGVIKAVLVALHLVQEDAMLLNNSGAVLLVLVYMHLPFAILPLYAAAEKFDFALLDAARDLGAGAGRAFWLVFLPGIRQGVSAAAILVSIACLGQYVAPQIVGGVDDEMIGNRIVQRAFGDRNLPLASAMSGALLLLVLAPAVRAGWRGGREERS